MIINPSMEFLHAADRERIAVFLARGIKEGSRAVSDTAH